MEKVSRYRQRLRPIYAFFLILIAPIASATTVPISLTVTPNVLGNYWQMRLDLWIELHGFFPVWKDSYILEETVEHFVTVQLSDGTEDVFSLKPTIERTFDLILFTGIEFENDGARNSSLIALDQPGDILAFSGSEFIRRDGTASDNFYAEGDLLLGSLVTPHNGVWDPQLFRYTLNSVSYDLQSITLNPIPIPAAFWLFCTALIGLIGLSKRKERLG